MDVTKINEEKLREAACYGDDKAVISLLEKGVNVNAQHDINGWTALHWAAKRGFLDIVKHLIKYGADKNLPSKTGETPANVTDKEEIAQLLGATSSNKTESPLPITPNYLVHPCIGHKVEVDNPTISHSSPVLNGVVNHQPTEDELVLKVRIAHSSDPDFIEVEMPRCDLSYSRLLRVCCEELGIDLKHILKIRKLPDTVLRKDKDVRRLHDLQELELVLTSTRNVNGNMSSTSSNTSYSSIPGFRNCTILY